MLLLQKLSFTTQFRLLPNVSKEKYVQNINKNMANFAFFALRMENLCYPNITENGT